MSSLSEPDICTKFITTAVVKAGWDVQSEFGRVWPLLFLADRNVLVEQTRHKTHSGASTILRNASNEESRNDDRN